MHLGGLELENIRRGKIVLKQFFITTRQKQMSNLSWVELTSFNVYLVRVCVVRHDEA